MREKNDRRVPGIIGDRYRIVSEIGNGSYGTVYLGIDNKTGQKVAIKYMANAANSIEKLLNLREVKSLNRIPDSSCIVQLLDAIYLNGVGSFLVFELMDCDLLAFLRHYQQNRSYIPEDVVSRIMYRVFCALARVHNSGYYHRDLKPENILVNRKDGVAKLCDFGLVRDMRATTPLTPYIATRWYRSPEMLLEANDYGPPVDMWAAGCIMIEILQSRPIFEGKDNSETFQQIIEKLGGFEGQVSKKGGGEWPQGLKLLSKHRKFISTYQDSVSRFSKTAMRGIPDHLKRELSPEAVSLISRLLIFDPSRRLTAAQALTHPFCAKARAAEPHCAPEIQPLPRYLLPSKTLLPQNNNISNSNASLVKGDGSLGLHHAVSDVSTAPGERSASELDEGLRSSCYMGSSSTANSFDDETDDSIVQRNNSLKLIQESSNKAYSESSPVLDHAADPLGILMSSVLKTNQGTKLPGLVAKNNVSNEAGPNSLKSAACALISATAKKHDAEQKYIRHDIEDKSFKLNPKTLGNLPSSLPPILSPSQQSAPNNIILNRKSQLSTIFSGMSETKDISADAEKVSKIPVIGSRRLSLLDFGNNSMADKYASNEDKLDSHMTKTADKLNINSYNSMRVNVKNDNTNFMSSISLPTKGIAPLVPAPSTSLRGAARKTLNYKNDQSDENNNNNDVHKLILKAPTLPPSASSYNKFNGNNSSNMMSIFNHGDSLKQHNRHNLKFNSKNLRQDEDDRLNANKVKWSVGEDTTELSRLQMNGKAPGALRLKPLESLESDLLLSVTKDFNNKNGNMKQMPMYSYLTCNNK